MAAEENPNNPPLVSLGPGRSRTIVTIPALYAGIPSDKVATNISISLGAYERG